MLPLSLVLLALSISEAEEPAPAESLPVIVDGAGLLSPQAIEKATLEIRKIKNDFHGIDVFIETTKERPAATEEEKGLWLSWRKKKVRNETLDYFAQERARELRERRQTQTGTLPAEKRASFSGIYVVIVDDKDGKREVGVAAWPAHWGADSDVSWVKRDALRDVLLRKEAKDNPDIGLTNLLVRFRAQQMQIMEPPPSALGVKGALLIVGGLVGVWLALLFVRWRVNEAAPPDGPEPIAIYQPAMMGTLFGVPAAFWVNDELFRSLPPVVPPPTQKPDSFSLPPMLTLPPPGAVTQGGAEPFTLPPESSHGQPPTVV